MGQQKTKRRVPTLNKTELIKNASELSGESLTSTGNVLDSIMSVITTEVAAKQRVQLVGFGTFENRHREERRGINPSSGENIIIPAKDVPYFKPGKEFKDKLQQHA
jgi:DNA-binding protein HU-beta